MDVLIEVMNMVMNKIPKIISRNIPKSEEYSGLPEVEHGTPSEKEKWGKKVNWLGRVDKRRLAKEPEVSYFIVMLFPNGTLREWVILNKNVSFKFKGRTFVIDTNEAWFDLNQNQFKLIYHFEHAMPINKEVIPYVDAGKEAFLRIKSDNVEPIIKQEYVKVLASSNIDRYLMITMILTAISIFITLMLTGVVFFLANNINKLVK
jgi:hypothetical protein